jgi:hypothetical protein
MHDTRVVLREGSPHRIMVRHVAQHPQVRGGLRKTFLNQTKIRWSP